MIKRSSRGALQEHLKQQKIGVEVEMCSVAGEVIGVFIIVPHPSPNCH